MARVIFAAVVALAVALFALKPAKADEAPWCAVSKEGTDRVNSDLVGQADGGHVRFWHLANIGLCAAHVCF